MNIKSDLEQKNALSTTKATSTKYYKEILRPS